MVTTNNKDLYKKLLLLRSHGITKEPGLMHDNHGGWYYEMQELSHNYRLTDFQAALGISQLRRVYESFFRRQEIAKIYDEAFLGTKIRTPELNGNVTHAYHLYVILVPDRRNFYDYLVKNGIFAQIHYIPVHLMPYYKQFGWKEGDFPIAEKYYTSCISLPIYPSLTNEEQNYVIEKVLNFFK